jgi:hypothetical protein
VLQQKARVLIAIGDHHGRMFCWMHRILLVV